MASRITNSYNRVLLVSPAGPSGLSFALHPVPLGLECIAAVIREDVEDVMIYDQFLDKEPFSIVLEKFRPDLVGFSMSATEHNSSKELIKAVRKYNPSVPVIAGGFHPTGAPDLVLNELDSDVVCRGEGEAVFKEIVAGKPWDEIKGISFRQIGNGNKVFTNEDCARIKDLDTLPFPARDLRKKRGYSYKNNLMPDRAYDLMYFGRGCWGKCTFCCEPYFSHGTQRYRSAQRAFDEIMEIYKFHGNKPLRILISDPNILGQHKPIEQLADLLIAAGNGRGTKIDITFQVMSRTEHVVKHPDIVEKMIRAGMISWEVGLESTQEEDLKLTKKFISVEKQEAAVGILRSLGAEVLGTYVIGLESQTVEFIKTLPQRGIDIGCASGAFGIATPFPGSGFWDEMEKRGRIFETNWSRFDENNAVITHPQISPKELEDLRSWCMGRFWNLDTVLEQIYIEKIRVGPFKRKHKLPLIDFFSSVGGKLLFAANAGGELSNKWEGKASSQKDHYMKSLKAIFSAFINPRVETYFKTHKMSDVVDMRQFGKLFKNKTIQVILENSEKKICEFALRVDINEEGIENIAVTRKPVKNYNFLLRANTEVLYVPPNLSKFGILKNYLSIIQQGKFRIRGWWMLLKLIIWGISASLTARFGIKVY